MSGGRFDYLQYRFTEIIDEIEQEVFDNPHEFSEETIAEFKRGIELLREAFLGFMQCRIKIHKTSN